MDNSNFTVICFVAHIDENEMNGKYMSEREKLREGLGRVILCLNGAFVDADGNMLFYNSSFEPVKPLTMSLLQIAIRSESGLSWFKSEKDT